MHVSFDAVIRVLGIHTNYPPGAKCCMYSFFFLQQRIRNNPSSLRDAALKKVVPPHIRILCQKWVAIHGIWANLKDARSKEKLVRDCAVCSLYLKMREKVHACIELGECSWSRLHWLPSGGEVEGPATGKGGKPLALHTLWICNMFTHYELEK